MGRFAFSLRDWMALIFFLGMLIAVYQAGVTEGLRMAQSGRGLPANFIDQLKLSGAPDPAVER